MRWLIYEETPEGLKVSNPSATGEVLVITGREGGGLSLLIHGHLYSLAAIDRVLRLAGETALQQEELPDNMAALTD